MLRHIWWRKYHKSSHSGHISSVKCISVSCISELISRYSVQCWAGQSSHMAGDVFNRQSLNLLEMHRVPVCQGTQLILWFTLSSCLFPPRMQPFSMALEWCTSTIMHFSGKSNSVSSRSVSTYTQIS